MRKYTTVQRIYNEKFVSFLLNFLAHLICCFLLLLLYWPNMQSRV